MPIPIVYRKSHEAIQSYSFTDIAEGTGIILFYGGATKQQSTSTYVLSSSAFYGNDYVTNTTGTGKVIDYDFDVTFNTPRRLKGNAMVTATIGGTKNAGNGYIYFIAKLVHYNGSTETAIANAQSETQTLNSSTEFKTLTVKIPITSAYTIPIGHTLRLTMEVWSSVDAGAFSDIWMTYDPIKRDYSTVNDTGTTQLIAKIPFELDV